MTLALFAYHAATADSNKEPFVVQPTPLLPDPTSYTATGTGQVYEVGPGKEYASFDKIALHLLKPGDLVRVYPKADNSAYKEKLFIAGEGTTDAPIVFVGIPDANGNRPWFDGEGARDTTQFGNYYWNWHRQVILIGQTGNKAAKNIIFDGIEIRGAMCGATDYGPDGGKWSYDQNAAGLMVQNADNITIRRCFFHHNENGIFSGDTKNLTVEYTVIKDNGMSTGSNQEHNLYINGGTGSVFTLQFCYIGEELNDGQQVKSRAETTVIRYNRIEGGRNSQLDLVEDADNGVSDVYVYGNLIIKPNHIHNKRIVHFGGDNSSVSRTGTLYFFNNTVINYHDAPDNAYNNSVVLFMISEAGANVIANNNIIYSAPGTSASAPPYLYLYDKSYQANLTGQNNWISSNSQCTEKFINSVEAVSPGFVDLAGGNFYLAADSSAANIGRESLIPAGITLDYCYQHTATNINRGKSGILDAGAFE